MKQLATLVQVIVIALSVVAVWFMSGHNEAAFRYMGF